MEGCCPKLLDLIPSEREWLVNGEAENCRRSSSSSNSESHKLELRLGPPGEREEHEHNNNNYHLLSLGSNFSSPEKGSVWFNQRLLPVMGKESSQPCCTKVVADLQKNNCTSATPYTVVPNTSQKRNAPGPVVGWPPIRSFRKNLASSSSSKPGLPETQNANPTKNIASENPAETSIRRGLFKKINMDGIPIGRKVDLNAYDSYEKLASAVDELFRGLLAAQRDSCAGGIMNKEVEEKAITGLLDGSGEYTLVYEDNEGDRMLVGDVPWQMFVFTVKRLRVLKSSEVSAISLGSCKAKVQCRRPRKFWTK